MRKKTVCFRGYRPEKMPCGGDHRSAEIAQIKRRLQQAILDAIAEGYTHFISGMDAGWDLWALDTVSAIRDLRGDPITLEAAVPYHKELKGRDKRAYDVILSYADVVTVLSERYHSGVLRERDRYMIENADMLICYFDGKNGGTKNTVDLAVKKRLRIVNISYSTA